MTEPVCECCGGESEGSRICIECKEELDRLNQLDRKKAQARMNELGKRFWKYADWSETTYPDDEIHAAALDTALRWVEESDYGTLYIHGSLGSGKTGLAWSTLRHHIEVTGFLGEGDFVDLTMLFPATRAYFNGKRDTNPLEGLDSVYLLVLDDLGIDRPTPYTVDALSTLIGSRYVQDRRTIVTSNYSPSALINRLATVDPIAAERIVSRLVETCTRIELNSANLRLVA
jgi:DNA replication protein DnaC